jgi:hypothetical protein
MSFKDYPWVWPPSGFETLDLNGSLAVPPSTTQDVFPPYTIPILQDGWITLAGVELSSYIPGVTFYQLTLDGKAIRNYEALTVPLGAPETPAVLYIRLRPNQKFALRVTNGSVNANLAVRWRFYGWYYPLKTIKGFDN